MVSFLGLASHHPSTYVSALFLQAQTYARGEQPLCPLPTLGPTGFCLLCLCSLDFTGCPRPPVFTQ